MSANLTSLDFGDSSIWTNVFSIEQTKEVQLTKINYKQRENLYELIGIQLEFSNGEASPMFEIESNIGVDDEPIEVKTIEIGDYNYLSKISMLIKDLNKISGLMLIDQNNDFASQANWDTQTSGARPVA